MGDHIMKRVSLKKTRLGVTIFVASFFLGSFSGNQSFAAQPGQNDILARWGNQVITRQDLELRIQDLPPDMQAALKDPRQKREYLESLIQVKITGAEAKAGKLDKKKKVAARIDDMTNSILLQEYMTDKLKRLSQPTEEQARLFYEQNKKDYLTPVSIHARHILIEVKSDAKDEDVAKAESRAKQAYDEAAAGGDFNKLVEKYSDDMDTKTKGGDLGVFQAEQVDPDFAKTAFSMKKGELSKPFRTSFGFHVVKIDDRIPARQMDFQEVKDDALLKLDDQNRDQLVSGELERLRKKYKVKIYEIKE